MSWPKYWSFSCSISPSNGHPGLISFRMDWLDLPAVQGTLRSLLQHHSSKASILRLKHTSNPPWQQLIYLPSNLVLLQACKSETQGVTLGSFLCLNLHIQMLSMLSSKCLLNSYYHPHYYHRLLSCESEVSLHFLR